MQYSLTFRLLRHLRNILLPIIWGGEYRPLSPFIVVHYCSFLIYFYACNFIFSFVLPSSQWNHEARCTAAIFLHRSIIDLLTQNAMSFTKANRLHWSCVLPEPERKFWYNMATVRCACQVWRLQSSKCINVHLWQGKSDSKRIVLRLMLRKVIIQKYTDHDRGWGSGSSKNEPQLALE